MTLARAVLAFVVHMACATTAHLPPPSPTRTAHGTSLRRDDCPDEPAVELFAWREESLHEAFRTAGHITALTLTHLDDDPSRSPWITGELDVKGTRVFEARTRALAAESYANVQRGGPPVAMVLALRGRVIAHVEIRSAMRGGRFLLRVSDTAARDPNMADELSAALREDRRCRAGTEPSLRSEALRPRTTPSTTAP
jgi:hypothetical protein